MKAFLNKLWKPGLNKAIILFLLALIVAGLVTPEEHMERNEADFMAWFGIIGLILFSVLCHFKDRPGR